MELQPGREAVVRVAVATLWTSPEAVRPVDRPALAARTDIPAWISGMDSDQQVGDCVLSQLLLGERVLVTELRPDGWAHVIAVEQPAAKLDPRGYPGWLPADQLVPVDAATSAVGASPLVLDASVSALRATPDGPVVLPGVILGTRLAAAGPARDGWRPVHAPGHTDPLWLPDAHLAELPAAPPTAAEVLAVAQRLLDVVYVWGGVSAYGIDCSGLVHLAWRRFGVQLPRDADDQAAATVPLALGDERPGDLYFFARPGRKIHHIGIVTAGQGSDGDRRMLHACYRQRRVVEEALPADRVATLVGVHRV
ncbi:C40 family peptidase [Micromonospora avicenniae]|uniref:Cell wall-associated hydrolase, NlpC family n=1 Tax=Micromonospora avicenniae TaxID=1198245 RepID=A0A1N6SAW1_9ACTN|nr:C40 family peptidase [Micromonospora avicenniae]SIQ38076.1 Cell wall-associated hydrolase, NlpC family [Micromonospora avicenniae]